MSPEQEKELLGMGPCFSHFHPEDRKPSQRLMQGLRAAHRTVELSGVFEHSCSGKEDILKVDSSLGSVNIILPLARYGSEVTVVKLSPLNQVTISTPDGKLILGASSIFLSNQWASRTLRFLGDQWYVLSGWN